MKKTAIAYTLLFIFVLLILAACTGQATETQSGILRSAEPRSTEDSTATSVATFSGAGGVSPTEAVAQTSDTPSDPTKTPDPPTVAPTEAPPPPTEPPSATPSQTAPAPTTPPAPNVDNGNVLPGHRVISYYGHPSTATMGILGAYSMEDAYAHLQETAKQFEAADPDTPVILAFELIATVAQPVPGDDGTYTLYTGDEWIGEYVDFATAHDMLVILDLQIGFDTIPNQINTVRRWLELPNVHVALDPEFSTGPNDIPRPARIPGSLIGESDGNNIQLAVEMLSKLVKEKNLPNKILIVHQFEDEMIYNKGAIKVLEGVDFVVDMDGFGAPEGKLANYDLFVRQQLIEYGGIKLFFDNDTPMLTPETVVTMEPPPLVVIYQ